MAKKNISLVRRSTNRSGRPLSNEATPLPSPKDLKKMDLLEIPEAQCKLYVVREDLDFDWIPSNSAVLKVSFKSISYFEYNYLIYNEVSVREISCLFLNFSYFSHYVFRPPCGVLLATVMSTAFLPSSFAMAMNMYAMAAYINEKW
uniref:Anoctamin n=1 Tax=Heterorhabditis bacteriophora TaxID=37862 RepID=A0A1I7X1L5_HETBA